ncbi:DUF559 domain-containing protein [Nocardioides sp. LS1]|uniref:DUF559 domain-containing protein n=1 Tax=Nocardioides sp. LS1 TaxID=1027620 RepID=UPI000FFAEA09|nr:DUF559 domain-containing protein [Nocardioides sp. LS1]GCD90741.1 hypothetical protein NLS1_27470 [Nocardioides sp. LS1]
MDPVGALERLGGIATTERLLRLTTPARLRAAWLAGTVVRLRRGIYALPGAERAIAAAARFGGIVSHLSAAQLHGWEVAFPPTCPWVTVPRNREVRERRGSLVFWADLDDERRPVTTPLRTVLDCGRRLAPGPALAVADSALRHRAVDRDELEVAAAGVRGKGAAKVRWIAAHADGRAFNPFESMLRELALRAGLDVVPQQPVGLPGRTVHPDLVDLRRRLVIEADSWEFHTGREAHDRDCRRYDELVLAGWTVLRFTWRQVMHDPDWVLECLRSLA